MTVCKNCTNQFEGNYCNNCGQTSDTHRFTLKHIIHEAVHTFTHADKGLLKLIPDLMTKPGETVRNYIAGQRKRYFNPIQFLFIMTAITTFLTIQFHLAGASMADNLPDLTARQYYLVQFSSFVYKYINIVMLLSIPIFAMFARIFFFRSGYNYAENLIMVCFYGSERSVIYTVIFVPIAIAFREHLNFIMISYTLTWMIYFYYAYAQFFMFRGVWMFTKGALCVFFSYVCQVALMFSIFTIFFYKK